GKNVKTPKTPVMKESGEDTKLDEIYDMIKSMMMKLEALDKIEERMKTVENNVMEVKKSIEFAHAEIIDLKDETRENKKWLNEAQARINNLEETNRKLRDSVIDLKARSMRDNLLFFNIPEEENEDTTQMIHKLLEEKLEIQDATHSIKIDRSHRLGKQHPNQRGKPRPIVAKQFPEDIEETRRKLYPEMRKAKLAKKRVRL
ncbi:Hypothetical predicted protein, partial [Paramuricea clavata]